MAPNKVLKEEKNGKNWQKIIKIEIVQKLCLTEGRQWGGGGRDRELPVASTPNYPLCGEAELWGDSGDCGDCDTTHLPPHT